MPQKIPHDHFCNECGALYPCPNLEACPFSDDPDDFADAVVRLWDDPALRTQLGDAGWAHYRDRFTWPAAWRKLDESGGI